MIEQASSVLKCAGMLVGIIVLCIIAAIIVAALMGDWSGNDVPGE